MEMKEFGPWGVPGAPLDPRMEKILVYEGTPKHPLRALLPQSDLKRAVGTNFNIMLL